MRLIIAGGRDFTDEALLWATIQQLFGDPHRISYVVCGMAKGADRLGMKWADTHNIKVKRFWPKTNEYGLASFKLRNWEMAFEGDELLAFWNGVSGGTRHMMNAMNSLHKPVWVRMYPPTERTKTDLEPPPPLFGTDNLFSITDHHDF